MSKVVADLAAHRASSVLLEASVRPLVLVFLSIILTAGDLLAMNVFDTLHFFAYFVDYHATDQALTGLADEHVAVDY